MKRKSARPIAWQCAYTENAWAKTRDCRNRTYLIAGAVDEDDEEDIEAKLDDEPDTRRLAFLLRADQARLFAKYTTGPIDDFVMETARAALAAWAALVEDLEQRR